MRGWVRQAAGGLPRTFWLLWAGTLINRMGAFVIIFMALYLTGERGFTQSQAGLVIGLYGVGGAIGTMTGGVLADRWGRRPTLLLAQFGAAALMVCLGFAHAYWQIAATALLLGALAEMMRPAFSAMMIDVVPVADRVRAFSLNYWAINLGFAMAAALAGLAAQVDYLLLFLIDAGTTVACGLITLLFIRETRPARPAKATTGPGIGAVFRDRVFVGFVLLNMGLILVVMQHMSTLPLAMSADGLSPATFGAVIAVNGVLIVCGQLFIPRLIEGRDRARVLALANVIVGAGFGLVAFVDTAWLYVVTVVIWTLGEMLASPSASSLVAELSPTALRGRYQGVNSLSWSAGVALAPVVGGLVQQHLGDPTLWLGCLGLTVAAAAGQRLAGPSWSRRIARLAAAENPATAAEKPATATRNPAPATETPATAVDEPEAQRPPEAAGPVAEAPLGAPTKRIKNASNSER